MIDRKKLVCAIRDAEKEFGLVKGGEGGVQDDEPELILLWRVHHLCLCDLLRQHERQNEEILARLKTALQELRRSVCSLHNESNQEVVLSSGPARGEASVKESH